MIKYFLLSCSSKIFRIPFGSNFMFRILNNVWLNLIAQAQITLACKYNTPTQQPTFNFNYYMGWVYFKLINLKSHFAKFPLISGFNLSYRSNHRFKILWNVYRMSYITSISIHLHQVLYLFSYLCLYMINEWIEIKEMNKMVKLMEYIEFKWSEAVSKNKNWTVQKKCQK